MIRVWIHRFEMMVKPVLLVLLEFFSAGNRNRYERFKERRFAMTIPWKIGKVFSLI